MHLRGLCSLVTRRRRETSGVSHQVQMCGKGHIQGVFMAAPSGTALLSYRKWASVSRKYWPEKMAWKGLSDVLSTDFYPEIWASAV